jgi:hypothetical protein
LPLPELVPWHGDATEPPPDVEIVLGTVPAAVETPLLTTPFTQIGADGTARLEIAGVATYWVSGGRRILVEPQLNLEAPDIGLFLLGSAFGFLCHQRGVLPLHASCLEIDGRAVAFAGPSGTGKSTLAASLMARGHRLIADDITVVDLVADGGPPMVLPSFPRMKLWRDSLDALGLKPGRPLRSDHDTEKFEHISAPSDFRPDPIALAMVCHLSEATVESRQPWRLSGPGAVDMARHNIYRRRIFRAMAGPAMLFRRAAALASAVPQVMLFRPLHLADLPDFAAGLPELLRRV